ncbi:hypothetical protein CL616_01595 [archaeon]|nr:hypothetical protein [archaeon]|tara:strand:+ start:1872 stop:2213 length:342 start_codon:yes stop_codon:yes gene_type:complete
MKWLEIIGVIVALGALLQLINWILDSLGFQENIGEPLVFILSFIFTFLIIITIILVQLQINHNKIKRLLKKNHSIIKRDKMLNKKGMIDARILLILLVLFFLYLIYLAVKTQL